MIFMLFSFFLGVSLFQLLGLVLRAIIIIRFAEKELCKIHEIYNITNVEG